MAISTIGTDALASAAVTSAKLASGAPSRSQLPAGTVLQVVSANYSTQVINSSGSQVSTGLTATITPSNASNKVLVIVNDPMRKSGGSISGISIALWKNGSFLYSPMSNCMYSNGSTADQSIIVSFNYLDSPATTTACTYTLYFGNNSGVTAYAQIDGANNVGTITLMEIAV